MDRSLSAERNVYPRWRSIDRTPSAELLSSCPPVKISTDSQQQILDFFYKKWQRKPAIEHAMEVVNVAITMKDPHLAVGPAKMIISDSNAMPAVKAVAQSVLSGPKSYKIEDAKFAISRKQIGEQIHQLKQRLNNEPMNGLAWLDKARLQTRIGDLNKAEKSIRVALGCAPDNRFILRAFTRFMTHIGAPAEAHDKIKLSSSIKTDPWIQAAEISVAEASGRPSTTANWGLKSLEQSHLSPIHTSELASALATLEFNNGKNKKAKRLFQNSLASPTENALAQAFWVQREKSLNIKIDKHMLSIDGAFEARVQAAVADRDWNSTIQHCMSWLNDEPFSLRAATDGSFYSSSCLRDDELAIEFCNNGLLANPNDATLINNKIVSLCRLGELETANSLMSKGSSFVRASTSDPVSMATKGLFSFRSDNVAEGRAYYLSAAEEAKKTSKIDTLIRVKFHWLYEEARSGMIQPETLHNLINEIDKQIKSSAVRSTTSDSWSIMKKEILEIEHHDTQASGNLEIVSAIE